MHGRFDQGKVQYPFKFSHLITNIYRLSFQQKLATINWVMYREPASAKGISRRKSFSSLVATERMIIEGRESEI